MAVSNRNPAVDLVHHSDHGAQCTSLQFGSALRKAGIMGSMGPLAILWTMPSQKALTQRLKLSCSIAAAGPRVVSYQRLSLSTLKYSTTVDDYTPLSVA